MKNNVIEFEKEHWFFYTSTVFNYLHLFQKAIYRDIVLESLKFFIENKRIYIGAFVIMPNHIHLILKTRNGHKMTDINQNFKKYTAQKIISAMKDKEEKEVKQFVVNKKDRKIQIWKRDPNIQNVFSSFFLLQKMKYIHENPIRKHWNLANTPEEYPYSSASFYTFGRLCPYFELFHIIENGFVGENTNE